MALPAWRRSSFLRSLTVVAATLALRAAEAVATDSCPAGADASGSCVSATATGRAEQFWAEMRKRGLQLRIKKTVVKEKAQAGRAARNRTGMVVRDDVFYGRAIMKIPRPVLLSSDTAAVNAELRQEINDLLFEEKFLERKHNVTGEDGPHLLSLAYPLIAENRDPSSVFREWLDAVQDARLPVLQLSERQRRVLNGTTVDGAYDEMRRQADLIELSASNFSIFKQSPVSPQEAGWALAVIMRHARVVHPHQDVRETRDPRMYLFPLVEMLGMEFHHDPSVGISFQEEITYEGKKEEEMVLQIARRDMPKGEEVFIWPGRFSNSDMIVRFGQAFPFNRIGIGRNVTQPPNWDDEPESQVRREYAKYNCTNLESFEMRLSIDGVPMRSWRRCYRISWFFSNGWYSPALLSRTRDLERWPPPDKYTKEDWLSWTQADAELIRVLLDYCETQRQRLKDTIDSSIADDFRKSRDPMDRLLWHLRGEESKTFKACISNLKKLAATHPR